MNCYVKLGFPNQHFYFYFGRFLPFLAGVLGEKKHQGCKIVGGERVKTDFLLYERVLSAGKSC